MSEFVEICDGIEREAEKKYPGYRRTRWGEWISGRSSLLDNADCSCNGSFDHAAREWHHHTICPAFGDDRAWEDHSVEFPLAGDGKLKFIRKRPVE